MDDYNADAGLHIDLADDGQLVVKDDGMPEARRRRPWGGNDWIEDQAVVLPAPTSWPTCCAAAVSPTTPSPPCTTPPQQSARPWTMDGASRNSRAGQR
jgi:hypothetical protein